MFCLMDVSGSMTEHMKDLAKRFYQAALSLSWPALQATSRVVFIRHTHLAREVDEETFFMQHGDRAEPLSPPRFEEMLRVAGRPVSAKTSGISMPRRLRMATTCLDRQCGSWSPNLLRQKILPMPANILPISRSATEHGEPMRSTSDLWRTYAEHVVQAMARPVAMRKRQRARRRSIRCSASCSHARPSRCRQEQPACSVSERERAGQSLIGQQKVQPDWNRSTRCARAYDARSVRSRLGELKPRPLSQPN